MIETRAIVEVFALRDAFVISRGARTETTVVTVSLHADGARGRGESVPMQTYGESPREIVREVEALGRRYRGGWPTREELAAALPAGATRCALDAALWDLEAQGSGVPVWRRAGLDAPPRSRSVRTVSLGTPAAMGEQARRLVGFGTLKLKLGGDGDDRARVAAVREAAGDCELVVDANESWAPEPDSMRDELRRMADLGVVMVEQPLPRGHDHLLADIDHAVPVCADESFHTPADLDHAAACYDAVNLKLEKTGGLTAALALAAAARERALGLMVGCMVGTSLGMAPALVLAQQASVVDLDAPYLLAVDREPSLALEPDGWIGWNPELWGG